MNRILIVEDNPNTREMLQRHLTKAGYEVFEAESGEMALAQIKRDLPDLVLLDMTMPGMSGVEVCHKLHNTPQSELIYIIIVTAVAGIEQRIHGLNTGANDYVTKPFDIEELLARIRVALRTVNEKRDAVLDPLTKLYNKSFFSAHLAQEVSKAQRYQRRLSLIMGDIDHFKHVNDTYGDQVGDAVIVEIGKILRIHCRRSDIPARWGWRGIFRLTS